MAGNRIIACDDALSDQWMQERRETRRMATGNGDALAVLNGGSLTGGKLRKTVGPQRVNTMRGAGIENSRSGIAHRAADSIDAASGRHRNDTSEAFSISFRAAGSLRFSGSICRSCTSGHSKPLVDLQTRRTFLTVNENLDHGGVE